MNKLISVDNAPDRISPEGSEVANTYLKTGCDVRETAYMLNMEPTEVTELLNDKYVKNYINTVMKASAMSSLDLIHQKAMDIMLTKLQELEEAEMGSSKDILDILNSIHKMQKERIELIQKEEKQQQPINQKNTQNNLVFGPEGSNYMNLLKQLT